MFSSVSIFGTILLSLLCNSFNFVQSVKKPLYAQSKITTQTTAKTIATANSVNEIVAGANCSNRTKN